MSTITYLIVGALVALVALESSADIILRKGPARKINDYAMDHKDYVGNKLVDWYHKSFKGSHKWTESEKKLKIELGKFVKFLSFSGPKDCTGEFLSVVPEAEKLAFSYDEKIDDKPYPRITHLFERKKEEYQRECRLDL